MLIYKFDVIFENQVTGEIEITKKEYTNCNFFEALDKATAFVKEELKRKHDENKSFDWYLNAIKNYLA